MPEVPGAAWSVITASSELEYLELRFSTIPAGACQHLFATGQQLPRLHTLDMRGSYHMPSPEADLLQPADLARLAGCCPALQKLHVLDAVQPGATLTALQQLQQLQELRISGLTNETIQQVAQLTGLTSLTVWSGSVDVAGWRHISSLQSLHILECHQHGAGHWHTATRRLENQVRELP